MLTGLLTARHGLRQTVAACSVRCSFMQQKKLWLCKQQRSKQATNGRTCEMARLSGVRNAVDGFNNSKQFCAISTHLMKLTKSLTAVMLGFMKRPFSFMMVSPSWMPAFWPTAPSKTWGMMTPVENLLSATPTVLTCNVNRSDRAQQYAGGGDGWGCYPRQFGKHADQTTCLPCQSARPAVTDSDSSGESTTYHACLQHSQELTATQCH